MLTMLALLLIVHLAHAYFNDTNITGDPKLPNEIQPTHASLAIGEVAMAGMIPSALTIMMIAIIRILHIYRLRRQTAESCIKPDENVIFTQLNDNIREL